MKIVPKYGVFVKSGSLKSGFDCILHCLVPKVKLVNFSYAITLAYSIIVRDKLSGTIFSFPGIGNSREFSAIPGKFPGIAKSTKILGISRGWTMIYAFNWTNMKNKGYN